MTLKIFIIKQMLKNLLLLIILLPFFVFSQNVQSVRNQAQTYYEKGEFLKSYQLLNTIKDKNVLQNTNINFFKSHLENIMNYRFFKKTKLNDSLYKVYFRTNILKSQGVYNEKSKKYTVPPVYDSIPFKERYFKYLNLYKNNQEAFVNIETGKIIVPLGNHICASDGVFVYVDTKSKYGSFSYDDLITVFDINGNLLFKDMDTFNPMYYSNCIVTKNKNNKYQILDIKKNKILLDDCDYFFRPSGAIVENEILYDNIWLPFHKNNQNYLYKITADDIVDTHKFDTYVPMHYNYNYFDNALTTLINIKDNAPYRRDPTGKISFFSYYNIVKKGDKYGIFNLSKDKYFAEPIYDSISKIGNTFYNGKWINLVYGEEICMPISERPEGIIFKKNNLFGLMDLGGTIVAEAEYDEVRYLSNEVFIFRKGTKWGFKGVLKDDKLVLPEFDYIEYRAWDFGNIGCYKSKKAIMYSRNGSKIDLITFENRKLKKYKAFEKNSFYNSLNDLEISNEFDRQIFEIKRKYGLDDFESNEVVAGKYSNIKYGHKNTYIASLGSLTGLIDHNGKEIIPIKYANIELGDYHQDIFFVTFDNGLKAIFNSEGIMLYPPKIKEVITYDYQLNTKTALITVTEPSQDETEKNNSVKKEEKYKKGVIKIKENNAEKLNLDGSSFQFYNSNFIMSRDDKNGKVVFYNLKNGKIIDTPFNEYFIYDSENQRIFARKGYYYDTVIDSLSNELTLEHPFEELKNGNYFFKEGNNSGVMNKNLQAANFRYPVLRNSIDREYQYISPYPSKEYRERASFYFKFNTNKKSIKDGLIKFDGTIVFEPETYDDIQFVTLENRKEAVSFAENEILKKYGNDVFVCVNNKKEYKTIQLVTSKNDIIAKFELNNKGSWNFGTYYNAIIIRSGDSVKVYDLKSKKIEFEKPTFRFEEVKDSGYMISYIDQKTAETKYEHYDYKGKLISKATVEKKVLPYGETNENYIVKRNDKYGTFNSKGKKAIPFEYDYLQSANGKLFISKKDYVYGIIDANNQTIIDKKYQDIQSVEIKDKNSSYRIWFSGYKLKEKNKWGLLDSNLKKIVPVEFDVVKLSQTIITAKKDTLVSVYDYTGKELFTAAVDSIDLDSNNNYHLYKYGKRLWRDFNGNISNTNPYKSWEDELKSKNSKVIDDNYYLAKNDAIIYKTPVVSFAKVEAVEDFMGEDLEYLLIKDANNFYGLYTEDLKEILPFEYEDIKITKNEDFYIVRKAGKFGVIDSKNHIIIPFEYDNINFGNSIFFYCVKNNKVYRITSQNNIISIKKQNNKDSIQPIYGNVEF